MEAFAVSQPLKVLLLENIHPIAKQLFEKEGYIVESVKDSLEPSILKEKLKEVAILGIRSKTNIDQSLLNSSPNLLAIGAFCVGTNQIDLSACSQKGVAVFNAPFSNTRSVVEMAVCEIIMLLRGIYDKCALMHSGIWDKSSKNNYEVRGKK